MSWRTCEPMSEKERFVEKAHEAQANISALCREFEISRKTGYKWLARYEREGRYGLEDRSRRPRRTPNRTPVWVEETVLMVRRKYPTWGGRKIRAYLKASLESAVPSASTITAILRRHGEPLEDASKHRPYQRFERTEPNQLWQMDFKGHFAYGSGRRCHPLTVLDDHSRFLLGLRACANERGNGVKSQLTAIFRQYGLPETILVDNGPPWGNSSSRRFTRFSAWLVQLGITVRFSRPLHPQTLGKDERLHRTLKADLLERQSWTTLRAWQRAFDDWRVLYNELRPHEALQLQPPASRYRASSRQWPGQLPLVVYDSNAIVRSVDVDGRISFLGREYSVGKAFVHQRVALKQGATDGVYDVYFCHQQVTRITLRDK